MAANKIKYLIILILLFQCAISNARQLHWLPTIGDWDDGANWSLLPGGSACGCVPTGTDTVKIQIVGSIVTIPDGIVAKASHLDIGFNATVKVGTQALSTALLSVTDSDIGIQISGTLKIYGQLDINRTSSKGLFIMDNGTCQLEGGGAVNITAGVGTIDTPVHNLGSLLLLKSVGGIGELNIDSPAEIGILNEGSSGKIENHGSIKVDSSLNFTSVALFSEKEINNYGQIEISAGPGFGIRSFGPITNQDEATISIDKKGDVSFTLMDGLLENFGTIQISEGFRDALNLRDKCINYGVIEIYELEEIVTLAKAIHLFDTLVNHGTIQIHSLPSGITVQTGFIENHGLIDVNELLGSAILLNTTSIAQTSLVNELTGKIIVRNVVSGINTFNLFINKGLIEISDFSQFGIDLHEFNYPNSGDIRVFSPIGFAQAMRLPASSSIENDCAGLVLMNGWVTLDGQIINNGYFEAGFGIILGFGNFLNEGILSDKQSAFEQYPATLTNNGILIECLKGHHVVNVTSYEIMTGDISDFTFDLKAFYDPELLSPAGSFDEAQNTWTPASPAGFDAIYHPIANTCRSFSVLQPLDNPITATCPNPTPQNFVAEDGTWQSHDRWSIGQVPTFCHDVIVEQGKTVVVLDTEVANAKTIEVEKNGFFEVYGILEITGL